MSLLIQSQNLLKPESGDAITRPPGFYKDIALDSLAVVSALAVGYLYKQYVENGAGILILLAALLVFSIFAILQVLLTQGLGRWTFVAALETLALVVFFYPLLPVSSLVASAFAAFIFFFWGELAARKEIQNSVRIRFFSVVRDYATKFITGIVLLAIFLYFPAWAEENFRIPRAGYETFFGWGAQVGERLYPGVNFKSSFRDLATEFVRPNAEARPGFRDLSSEAKAQVLQALVDELIQGMQSRFGVAIQPEENAGDALYKFLNGLLERWREAFGKFFLFGWAIVIFLIVRGFGAIFMWVIALVSFFVYELLLAANFICIVSANVNQEILEYS